MRNLRTLTVIVLTGLAAMAAPADGRTWRVEKDGSGDFTVIQHSIDAASSGDVIEIGPGRYTDVTLFSWGKVTVWLDGTKSLTFVGAGTDQTIIGPEVFPNYPPYNNYGFACTYGNVTIRVENLRIENQNFRGMSMYNTTFVMLNCVIDHCYICINLVETVANVTIRNCQIIDGPNLSSSYAILCRSPHAEIRDVLVDGYWGGLDLSYTGSTDVLVTNSTFNGGTFGRVGLQFSFWAGGTVEQCHFTGWEAGSFVLIDAGTVVFRDNVVEDSPGAGVVFYDSQNFTMHGNIIDHCHPCILLVQPNAAQEVHGNHFFRDVEGGGYWVESTERFPYGPYDIDLTQNYWGTTDPQEISTWILDGYDDPDVWMYVVFEPMADGPVRKEGMTWGGVKALFR